MSPITAVNTGEMWLLERLSLSARCDVGAASQVLTVLGARPAQLPLINLLLIIQYTELALSSLMWRHPHHQSSGWVWVSHHLVCVFIITSLSPIIKLINMSQPIISITNNINLATENLSWAVDDHARPTWDGGGVSTPSGAPA